jgi:hypothetical protein
MARAGARSGLASKLASTAVLAVPGYPYLPGRQARPAWLTPVPLTTAGRNLEGPVSWSPTRSPESRPGRTQHMGRRRVYSTPGPDANRPGYKTLQASPVFPSYPAGYSQASALRARTSARLPATTSDRPHRIPAGDRAPGPHPAPRPVPGHHRSCIHPGRHPRYSRPPPLTPAASDSAGSAATETGTGTGTGTSIDPATTRCRLA